MAPSVSESASTSSLSSDSREATGPKTRPGFPPKALEVLQEVHNIIGSLQRLSMAIRHASKQARADKIAKFELQNKENVDMQDQLRESMSGMIKRTLPKVEEDLRSHLIAAVLLRQKRFLYSKEVKQNRLESAFPIVPEFSEDSNAFSEAPKDSDSPPRMHFPPAVSEPQSHTTYDLKSDAGRSVATSQNTAAAFDEKLHDINAIVPRKESAQSEGSMDQDKSLKWPSPPKLQSGQVDIECPYCFDILSEDELKKKKTWQ
jgi:hypothetical protein